MNEARLVRVHSKPASYSHGRERVCLQATHPQGTVSLIIYQSKEKPAHLHLAFQAASRAQVDAFYRAALEAGAKDNGPPGLRPDYHANYYAGFVIGPDGHNIEAVCHTE